MKMDAQKVDMYIMSNAKFFESNQLNIIRERLLALDDSKWMMISTLQFKDPTIILIVSILVGSLGIDRFIIGDTGLGLGKLLTCGGLGIWAIVDWFLIMPATREKNMQKIQPFLY
jgi:TM2 domain-containing membrane protein YozV